MAPAVSFALETLRRFHFVQNALILASHFVTLPAMVCLLYYSYFRWRALKTQRSLSASLRVYLFAHVVFGTLKLPYFVYVVVRWRPNIHPSATGTNLYNADILYILGMFSSAYMCVASVPVFFLTLDRILVLRRASTRRVILCAVLAVCVVYVGGLSIAFVEMPLQRKLIAHCEIYTCLLLKNRTFPGLIVKMTVSIANVVATTYFLILLRRCSSQLANTINNRVVKITVLFEIMLSIVPTFVEISIGIATGGNGARIVGPLTPLCLGVDSSACALFYVHTFLGRDRLRQWRMTSFGHTKSANRSVARITTTQIRDSEFPPSVSLLANWRRRKAQPENGGKIVGNAVPSDRFMMCY